MPAVSSVVMPEFERRSTDATRVRVVVLGALARQRLTAPLSLGAGLLAWPARRSRWRRPWLGCRHVPLGPRPWLHRLRSGLLRFVRRLRSYYDGVRLLAFVHHRLRLLVFPMRTCGVHPQAKPETSRFPRKELPHMPGSSTTPGRTNARADASVHVAFRENEHVGPRDFQAFAAQWLAYALPCRRFADTLADANARLGADAVRYSFIAVDFHHLLFAGFDRRTIILEFCTSSMMRGGQLSSTSRRGGASVVFDCHAFERNPRKKCVWMTTNSAFSGARRANVTGWEHESPTSRVWNCQNPSKVAIVASTRPSSGGCIPCNCPC